MKIVSIITLFPFVPPLFCLEALWADVIFYYMYEQGLKSHNLCQCFNTTTVTWRRNNANAEMFLLSPLILPKHILLHWKPESYLPIV